MTRILPAALIATLFALPAAAQEQAAGNEASRNTEETFQALIDACDDVDALMLRARIRLQIPRATEEAGAEAQRRLDEAFAQCGEGDVEGAKAALTETLAFAEEGVADNFGTEGSAAVAGDTETAEVEEAAMDEAEAEDDRPWWRFW